MRSRGLVVVVSTLALFVSACGGGSSSSGGQKSVTIGAILGLTGPAGILGEEVRTGLVTAVNQINDSGGAGGVHIDVKVTDNQVQPGPSVTQVQQQLNVNHAISLISMYTTSSLAMVPYATRARVPIFVDAGADPALVGNDYLYMVNLVIEQEAEEGMRYAHEKQGVNKMGVLVETDFTNAAVDYLGALAKNITGVDPVVETIDQSATTATPQIDKLLSSGVQGIYLATDGNIMALVAKQFAQENVTIPLPVYAAGLIPEVLAEPNVNAYDFTRAQYSPGADFKAAYTKYFPDHLNDYFPSAYTGNGYSIGMLLGKAIELAQQKGYGLDGPGMKRAVDEIRVQGWNGCCGVVKISDKHSFVSNVELVKVSQPNGPQNVVETVVACQPTGPVGKCTR